MPCQQITNTGISYNPPLSSRSGPFATEAECLQACKEGACCNGTTCSVKPQCQCDAAAGEVFKGVGTTCAACLICACADIPQSFKMKIEGFDFQFVSQTNSVADMSTYGQELSSLINGQELTLALQPQTIIPGVSVEYAVSQSSISVGCENQPARFARLTLKCTGAISNVSFRFESRSECWQLLANNRPNYRIVIRAEWLSPLFPFSICPSQRDAVILATHQSSSGITAQWIKPFGGGTDFSNTGSYASTAGTTTLTPIYTNPLP